MTPAATPCRVQKGSVLLPILWAGTVCGTMDITAALVVYGRFGLKPLRLLQGIAAGLLGPRSYDGGLATVLLGLFCHFFIACAAAPVFFTVSRAVPFLIQQAVVSGALYGVAVYFFHAVRRHSALSHHAVALLRAYDRDGGGDTHLLRRAAHCASGPAILGPMKITAAPTARLSRRHHEG